MKKKIFAYAVLLCMLLTLAPAALADGDAYSEQATKVITDGEAAGELVLRFYEATPHVPYLGLGAYSQFVKGMPLALRENADGTYVLINDIGEELFCDAAAGTITVKDWHRFFDLPLPLENVARGWKDTSLPFVRITDVRFEGEAKPVTLDLAKYGIRVYADRDDIYLPLSIVSNIMADISTYHMCYNGEDLYLKPISLTGEAPEGYYDTEKFKAEMAGEARPDDVVQQCYADLCFTFDNFFGHPGVAPLDEAIAEKGLDQALTELGEPGLAVREGLLSSDLNEYLAARRTLFIPYLYDGHTTTMGEVAFSDSGEDEAASEAAFTAAELMESLAGYLFSPLLQRQLLSALFIPTERDLAWGEDSYREYGSTAILRLDSFMPDEAAWNSYYFDGGPFPEDDLGNVIAGLKRASENPEIENVIFDLSCNGGGSPDVMMTILAMTTGQDQLLGYNRLTDRDLTFTFEVDANFDGVYDEKDRDVRYDFNYGVLVTRYAFSCGNLFPFIIQEGGAAIIGDPSSGGSCCVQVGTDSEGMIWMMSSAQWQLADSMGSDLEAGCPIDMPIEVQSYAVLERLLEKLLVGQLGMELDIEIPSFTAFFDDARLDEMMREWFAAGAELPMAA